VRIIKKSLANQDGFILVLGMAMLVVLTLIGLSAIRTSVTDIKIAGNERKIAQEFYVADSTWQIGMLWLNQQATVPDIVNSTKLGTDSDTQFETKDYYKIIRNFGDGDDGSTNEDFSDASRDGSFMGTSFWYKLLIDDGQKAVEFGEGYEDYPLDIDSTASGRTTIAARTFKVLKHGY
jgi:hypothetical protein